MKQQLIIGFHFIPNLLRIFWCPTPMIHSFRNFVVSTPHSQRSMISKSLNILNNFLFNTINELIITWIGGTRKLKILPQQYTLFICILVHLITFINATCPNTEHVHVGRNGIINNLLISLFCYVRQKYIIRNKIGTLSKYLMIIDLEIKRFTILVLLSNHLQLTNTYF